MMFCQLHVLTAFSTLDILNLQWVCQEATSLSVREDLYNDSERNLYYQGDWRSLKLRAHYNLNPCIGTYNIDIYLLKCISEGERKTFSSLTHSSDWIRIKLKSWWN